MATVQLTFSRASVYLTSTWDGFESGYNELRYTTPTLAEANVDVTVPDALPEDAVITSAHLSYTLSGPYGTRFLRYAGTSVTVTDANLLERLQGGLRSLRLHFAYRAGGGNGGEGTHSALSAWTNLALTVEYMPAGAVNGLVTASDGSTARYSLNASSLTAGESALLTLSLHPASVCEGVTAAIKCGDVTVFEESSDAVCPAGRETALTMTVSAFVGGLSGRVNGAKLLLTAGETAFPAEELSLVLLTSRLPPEVTAVWDDEAGLLDRFGGFVQGRSVPVCGISAECDGADESVCAVRRVLEIGTDRYEGGESLHVTEPLPSGSVPYTVTVTDSAGNVGTCGGTVEVLSYASPRLESLVIERCGESTDEDGNPVIVQDDFSDRVRVSLTGSISPLNGRNGWTLSCFCTDGETEYTSTLAQGSTTHPVYTQDTSLLPFVMSEEKTWQLTLTFSDGLESAAYDVTLPKAGGIFSIEKGGVAVGKRCTGTAESPAFQVAYPAVFEKDLSVSASWEPLSVENGITVVEPCAILRRADTVFVRGAVRYPSSLAQSAYVTVAALPEKYVPAYRHHRPLTADSPGYSAYAETEGLLRVRNRTGASKNNEWISLDCSYPVN